MLNKTTTGQANQRATAITIEITREGARRALQEYASASRHTLTLTTTESHVLFGMPIHLGEVRYTMTDVMLSEEDRQAVERALAAPGAEYVSLRLSATEHSRLQAIYPRWLPKGEPTSPS